ncbi:MAG TPA: S16 family serine protease [Candidatus Nanoarchaeia archaeon]|nr:S16 family serine protease [Candidatus Nanoarchaeia archaeon]
MRLVVFPIIAVLLVMPVLAQQGHMVLLAAHESGNGYEGSTADLYLELQPGKGRVFLETFPLTKIDTQIATRSAKEIACNVLDFDCGSYDFIYTIKAKTSIIGGPSAGAATALLTISMLKGIPFREDVAITGTINSYGLIGPVGGLKPKIEVASKKGIKKVLVPERYIKEEINATNSTEIIDLVEFGKSVGVEVEEVSDVNTAIFHLSGNYLEENNKSIEVDNSYKDTMKFLADDLCNRSKKLTNDTIGTKDELADEAFNLTLKGFTAYNSKDYYSSASFCFGANAKLLYLMFKEKGISREEIQKMTSHVMTGILKLDSEIEKKEIKTITDLEAFMAVKERLEDANSFLNKSISAENDSKLYDLAYANERLYSAYSWFTFFDHRGKEFNMNQNILRDSCQRVLLEIEERSQYLQIFFPTQKIELPEEFDNAYRDLENQQYALCLYKASKAKAEINVPLNTLGVTEEKLGEYVKKKLEIAKSSIARQSSKGIFPILGYSYYEYATNLAPTDEYSALLYSEYALELSNLDLYFQERNKAMIPNGKNIMAIAVVIAVAAGISIGYLVAVIKNPSRRKRLLGKKR